jgi:hypothetical protein
LVNSWHDSLPEDYGLERINAGYYKSRPAGVKQPPNYSPWGVKAVRVKSIMLEYPTVAIIPELLSFTCGRMDMRNISATFEDIQVQRKNARVDH